MRHLEQPGSGGPPRRRTEEIETRSWLLFGQIVGSEGHARSRGIQLADDIEAFVACCGLRAGDRLGTEQELARHFSASHRIVRQASRTLLARGAIEIHRGKAGGHVVAAGDMARAVEAFASALPGGDRRRLAIEARAMLGSALDREAGGAAAFTRAALARLATDGGGGAPLSRAGLAEAIAESIESDLAHWLSGKRASRSGVLDAMCDHYGASLPVIVQALRLLEDGGVLWLKKGRTGGILPNADRSARAVRAVHAYFATQSISVKDCDRMVRIVNIGLIDRASRLRANHVDLVDEALAGMQHGRDATAVGMQWYLLQRAMSDLAANPPLHLLAKCLAAYVVRLRPCRADLSESQARTLVKESAHIVANIRVGTTRGSAAAHIRCQRALQFSW